MKVLQLISSGGYYGAESMLVNLSRGLSNLGCQSLLGAFQNSYNSHIEVAERAGSMGLPVETIPCNSRMDRQTVKTIRDLLVRDRIDLVHTHGPKPNAYALAAARSTGIPLIATYHLDWPDRGVMLYAYHALDRILLRSFAHVVGVSPQIVASLRRAGIRHERVSMIDNGIEFNATTRKYSEFRAKVGAGTRTLIGVVGRLTPQKGHEYLLRAIPGITALYPETLFVFAGDGPSRSRLEAAVLNAGLSGRVIFAGQQSDMADVYAGLDVAVLPSINEGMPMTIIEAMGAGLPVIATRVGAVPDLVCHGVTGLLVESKDPTALAGAVCELLADPTAAAKLAAEGQIRVRQRFSAETMARRYLDLYQSVLRSNSQEFAVAATERSA